MPDGYLMGAVSSELAPIWARKNGTTGYSEGAPSPSDSKTHVLAMQDGTLLCSSENSSVLGVWRPDGLGRKMLAETGYLYNNMVEVPGGCVIGSGRATVPVYYYDSATDTLTDLKISGTSNARPELAIPYDGGVWLIVYRDKVYDIGRLDTKARTYTRLGNFGTFQPSVCAYTSAGVVLTGTGYVSSSSYAAVWQISAAKGLSAKYEANSAGSQKWKPIGYVGGKLLLSCGKGDTGAALLDVNANTFAKYALGGAFKCLLDPLAETKDYVWAGHSDGICRIAKSNGALEIIASASNSNDNMNRYAAHEVDGGWLILPRNSYGKLICYLARDTQQLSTLLSDASGSGGDNDVWQLPDGRYVAKQRARSPVYLCDIKAKTARALPGTEKYDRVLLASSTELIAASDDVHKLVWYDIGGTKQTKEDLSYSGNVRLMTYAPDKRYVVTISVDSILVTDCQKRTSVGLYAIPHLDERSISRIYRRGKWMIILQETNWTGKYGSSYVYMLDMRAWRVYEVGDGRATSLPYGERECERLF